MTLARRRVGAPAQRWFHGRRAYVCKRRPQGKGLETVRLLQRLGFAELGLHRIWGARSPLNHASARTMHAAGMVEEGTIRGHLFTRGAWRDSVVHSILREEYPSSLP